MENEQQMTLEEYCGEECAQSIRKILRYARQAGSVERQALIKHLRKEAAKQPKDSVHIALIKLAEQIESMESNQVIGDVKEFETEEKDKQ